MIATQPTLFEQRQPKLDSVETLEKVLRASGEWLTASQILALLNLKESESGKRAVRLLASESEWIISSPGSPGYKHLEHCTAEELNHIANSLISQGKEMIKRGLRIRRNAHKIFG